MKVALMRGGGLGDAILALPALAALRRRLPGAEITWVGHALHRELFADRDVGVEQVLTLPDRWRDQGALVDAFNESMARRGFDLAIQLHGGGRQSNRMVRSWHAGQSIGMATDDAPRLDRTIAYQPWQPEVLRFLEVIELLDSRSSDDTIRLHLPLTSNEAAGEALELIAVHPGASDPRRRWPAEKFIEVINASPLPAMLIGSVDESALCAEIASRTDALDLCGALSLTSMIRLIAKARLLLANDSGPRHVAEAVGTPSVSIYWFGNLINSGPMTRRDHHVEVAWRASCPTCRAQAILDDGTGMSRCGHTASWVSEVEVDAVIAGITSVASAPRQRQVAHQAGR